jgi:hypothetical protein
MMGGGESGPWSSEMVSLRSEEIWLMCQDDDLEFLGHDSLCACALQSGVCVLKVGEFVERMLKRV